MFSIFLDFSVLLLFTPEDRTVGRAYLLTPECCRCPGSYWGPQVTSRTSSSVDWSNCKEYFCIIMRQRWGEANWHKCLYSNKTCVKANQSWTNRAATCLSWKKMCVCVCFTKSWTPSGPCWGSRAGTGWCWDRSQASGSEKYCALNSFLSRGKTGIIPVCWQQHPEDVQLNTRRTREPHKLVQSQRREEDPHKTQWTKQSTASSLTD